MFRFLSEFTFQHLMIKNVTQSTFYVWHMRQNSVALPRMIVRKCPAIRMLKRLHMN
jgi:hypothetical protein